MAVTGGISFAIGLCCPPAGATLFTVQTISALTAGSQIYNQLLALPPDKRIEEFTKTIVHDFIKGLCLKKGLLLSSKISHVVQNIVGSIVNNKILAKNFIRGVKTYLDLCQRYPREVARKALNVLKQNPSLVEESRDLGKAAQEVAKIENNIKESGILQKILKGAKFTQRHDHQWETILSDGNKLIVRRDIGKHAHPIGKKYRNPVNHWNIQLQKLNTLNQRFEPYYNFHIIVDDKFNIVEAFGK